MKKIVFVMMSLPFFAGMWSCGEKPIVFAHEEPLFELRGDAILIEVIVPQGTDAAREMVYMTGPATGFDETTVIGESAWELTPSSNVHKWGIYVDPADLAPGSTLADGYYFVSSANGREKSRAGEDVIHTQTASAGQRINNVTVERWASAFIPAPEVEWPAVPDDRIQLRITVPAGTPDGYPIGVVGVMNGWYGNKDAWLTTQAATGFYYINLDPADFTTDTSLADKFFVCLYDTQDWWWFQNNDDGTGDEGPGLTLANAEVGHYYEITVVNWRNSADLPAGIPAPTGDEFLLKITVPDYTPPNSLIGVFGEWTGWDAMLQNPDPWTATMWPDGVYALTIPTAGLDLTKFFHVTLYYDTSTGGDWWLHQMNLDGSGDEGPGVNNTDNPDSPIINIQGGGTYRIVVPNWRNSADIH